MIYVHVHVRLQELLSGGHTAFGALTIVIAVLPWVVTSLVLLIAVSYETGKTVGQQAQSEVQEVQSLGKQKQAEGPRGTSTSTSYAPDRRTATKGVKDWDAGLVSRLVLTAVSMVPVMLAVPVILDYIMLIAPVLPLAEQMAQVG